MALNEMIAQGAQFNMPDPVAQYNKLAQMQQYQSQNELNRQEAIDKATERQRVVSERTKRSTFLTQFGEKLAEKGVALNKQTVAGMISSGVPEIEKLGFKALEALRAEEAFNKAEGGPSATMAAAPAPAPTPMGGAPAAPTPTAAAALSPTAQASIDDLVKSGVPREAITTGPEGQVYVGSYGSNVVGEPTMEQYRTPEGNLATRPQAPLTPLRVAANQMAPGSINAMAPAAPAPAAAPTAAPPQTQLQSLVDQYERFSRIANPDKRVENRIKFLTEEIARASKRNLYTVAGVGLVDADTKQIVYASQEKGNALAELQANLAAATDPKVRREIQARIDKETSHQPATSVTVSTEKTYGGKLADKLADRDDAKLGAAEKAPQLADSANRIISLVSQGNLFTGPIAGIKLNIARYLNVAGASNEEKISNTESLIAATGQSTLDAIKSAGLGTGQGFTDKDLKFLQQIAGGTFELTPPTLTRLATLQHQAAVRAVEGWNTRFTQIPSSATGALGLSTVPKVPPLVGASTSSGFKYLGKESN